MRYGPISWFHPCVDCGECDPIVLQFDHTRGKKFNIGDAGRKGLSLPVVLREISKCEVRCANCHQRKTARDFALSSSPIRSWTVATSTASFAARRASTIPHIVRCSVAAKHSGATTYR